jgi:hypothetical protein
MKGIIAALAVLTVSIANGQPGEWARLNQHKVTNRSSKRPRSGSFCENWDEPYEPRGPETKQPVESKQSGRGSPQPWKPSGDGSLLFRYR